MHEFFGNQETDIDSTPDSLRDSQLPTTCDRDENLSAYWVPALMVPNPDPFAVTPYVRVEPDFVRTYYLSGGLDDAASIENFPEDLQMIAGQAMFDPGPGDPPF